MTEPSKGIRIELLPGELALKIYDDALAPAVKQGGKALEDIAKAARLYLMPISKQARIQEMLSNCLMQAYNQVPEDRQVPAPPSITGPVLEKLKYLEAENPLTKMYITLLARAIDKDKVDEIHPAFSTLIEQLSPDEALIIYLLKDSPMDFIRKLDLVQNEFINAKFTVDPFPYKKLKIESLFSVYVNHLCSLDLVKWRTLKQDPIREEQTQVGLLEYSTLGLTDFGNLFVSACIPQDGFDDLIV